MTIHGIKLNLQKSLQIFIASVSFISIASFFALFFGYDKWVLGFAPSIIIFGLIGAFSVTKTIVYLSSIEGELEREDENALASKFQGIENVKGLFYILVPLIYGTVCLITGVLNYNILDMNIVNLPLTILILAITLVSIYFTLDHLSFSLFFISIVYGLTKTSKAKKVREDIADMFISDDYDVDKNIKKLIIKYVDRISWLESHLNAENEQEYKAKIASYQTIFNDLKDFIYGIDI